MIQIAVEGRTPLNLRNAVRDLDQRLAELLQEVGTSVLSAAKLDFQVKSRGGTGAGGITWEPLSPRTIAARARKHAGVKKTRKKTAKLTGKIRDIEQELKFLGGKGKSVKAKKKKLAKLKWDRKWSRRTTAGAMEIASRAQIGVDTGLLRNSATPGYQGPDGKGGNVLRIDGHSVTVGFGRTYAPYFDGGTDTAPARPLLPDPVPAEWQDDIDAIVDDWLADVLRTVD